MSIAARPPSSRQIAAKVLNLRRSARVILRIGALIVQTPQPADHAFTYGAQGVPLLDEAPPGLGAAPRPCSVIDDPAHQDSQMLPRRIGPHISSLVRALVF